MDIRKEIEAKLVNTNEGYALRFNDVKPLAEEITRLRAEIEERKKDRYEQTVNLREANDRELALEEEITRLRGALEEARALSTSNWGQRERAEAAEAECQKLREALLDAIDGDWTAAYAIRDAAQLKNTP